MSVPAELMDLMAGKSGGQQGQMPQGGPVSAPMSTPQENKGEQAGASVQVQMAMDLLEQTIPVYGSESEEGQIVLDALRALGKKFASKREKGRELIPSEVMNLVSSMPKPMQGGGEQPPGAPPGGMPPGAQPPQM